MPARGALGVWVVAVVGFSPAYRFLRAVKRIADRPTSVSRRAGARTDHRRLSGRAAASPARP